MYYFIIYNIGRYKCVYIVCCMSFVHAGNDRTAAAGRRPSTTHVQHIQGTCTCRVYKCVWGRGAGQCPSETHQRTREYPRPCHEICSLWHRHNNISQNNMARSKLIFNRQNFGEFPTPIRPSCYIYYLLIIRVSNDSSKYFVVVFMDGFKVVTFYGVLFEAFANEFFHSIVHFQRKDDQGKQKRQK